PADRIETPPRARDQRRHRRPPEGVLERAHHPARLVEDDRAALAGCRHALAVEGDRVAPGVGARAEGPHRDPVRRDAAGQDQRLGVPPRGHPRGAEDLLQALAQAYTSSRAGGDSSVTSTPPGVTVTSVAASTVAPSPRSRSGGSAFRSGRPNT